MKLRIAIILDDMYPSSGGVSRSIEIQIEELARLGHQVFLIAPQTNLIPPQNATSIGLDSFRFPGLPLHTRILKSNHRIAKKICAKQQFDIVHSQTDTGAIILAARIAKIQGIPHVHTFHTNIAGTHRVMPILTFFASLGYRLNAYKIRRISGKRPQFKLLKLSPELSHQSSIERFDWRSQALAASALSAIATPLRFMLRYIRAAAYPLHLPGSSIATAYHQSFKNSSHRKIKSSKTDSKLRFISVSRIVKEKRLDVIIKAFELAEIPNSELLIVGDGAELAKLHTKAQNMTNIKFTGHISKREDISQLLTDSDVFVLASYRFDNQPIVITESLATGLPLLYCDDQLDVGLNPGNSLLTGKSAHELAIGMQQLADPTLRQKLADGTKSIFKELSPQKTAKNYLKLYHSAIKSMKTPSN